jgi:hypothetical protein
MTHCKRDAAAIPNLPLAAFDRSTCANSSVVVPGRDDANQGVAVEAEYARRYGFGARTPAENPDGQ